MRTKHTNSDEMSKRLRRMVTHLPLEVSADDYMAGYIDALSDTCEICPDCREEFRKEFCGGIPEVMD